MPISLDTETTTLSADIPTSAELITNMNTNHFTNNGTTNKIEINSGFKPTTTGTADTAGKLTMTVNIAGVGFDGSGSISIPYDN